MIIYRVEHKETGKIYIGQTIHSMERRINHHFYKNDTYFDRALQKYGRDAFAFSIIDSADSAEELSEKERYWIRFYDCVAPNGFNLTTGGDGGFARSEVTKTKLKTARRAYVATPEGKKHMRNLCDRNKGKSLSEETKKKMSDAGLGRTKSAEWKEKIRTSNIITKRAQVQAPGYVCPAKGKKHPHLAALNKARVGIPISSEVRQKTSKSCKAYAESPEGKAKIKARAEARKGYVHSEETRRKMRESAKNRYQNLNQTLH